MDLLKRAWVSFVFLLIAIVVGASGACGFDPQIADGAFACSADKACPDGFSCAADNKCYRPGSGPTSVPDAGGETDGGPAFVPSKIQVDPISAKEGDTGTTDFVFVVRLDPASTREVTVAYATNDGTAKTPDDYGATAGNIVFPPGSTSQQVVVKVIGDHFEEPDETFTLKLTNPVNATVAVADTTATILNDDGPGVSVDDITVEEGDTDKTVEFLVSLSGTYTTDVTMSFATMDGTAKAGTDYIAAQGSLTFAPGDKTKTIPVVVKGDLAHEPTEAFTVVLSSVVGAPVIRGTATATIQDNDPIPTLSIADAQVTEGDSGTTNMTFTVTLSAASGEVVKVNYATGGGTATTADYSATSGTLTFPAGTTSQQITVAINGDLTDEVDETFIVTLSMADKATIAKATATGTIVDDDAAPIVTLLDVAQAEGDVGTKPFSFVFTLGAASSKTITITYQTANVSATAGSDYVAASGTVTFNPGDLTKSVDVTVNGDTTAESTETFNLNLSNPQNVRFACGACTTTSALGTIVNDDGASAKFSIDDQPSVATNSEGNPSFVFNVTCTGTITSGTVNVDYTTASLTATQDVDFTGKSGTLVFSTCGTSQQITVPIIDDNIYEPTETFAVNISTITADAAITDSQGIGTIGDNDTKPQIDITSSVSALEGNTGTQQFAFDVTLSNPASTSVTVNYTTGGGTATAGTDYVTTSGTLTFAPGELLKTINVTVNGDVVFEPDETFLVTLSSNSVANSTLGTSVGTGTITNDETLPTITINDVTHNEGNSGPTSYDFTVTLSGPSYQQVSVNFATADGSATAGSDYTAKSGTLNIPAGQTTGTISIAVTGDNITEPTETFFVNLTTPIGATIADNQGLGTITNDDNAILMSINDASANEGSQIGFTITLSSGSIGATSVTWTLVDVSTTSADRQSTTTGTINFTNGQMSRPLPITTTQDGFYENDETFQIVLSNATGTNVQISNGTGTGTIVNDDAKPTLALAPLTKSVTEGNSGTKDITFTVTLTGSTNLITTVAYATANVTATGGGNPPYRDYVNTNGTLTFNPGDTQKSFTVTVNGDTDVESDETFTVTISNATNANINNSAKSSTVTITNDD